MDVICDNDQRSTFEKHLADVKDDCTIVQVEMKTATARRQDFIGLDKAMELPVDSRPVVLVSFVPELMLANDPRWHALMANPRVVFGRMPLDADGLREVLAEARAAKRLPDPLAVRLYEEGQRVSVLGTLKHDIRAASEPMDARHRSWMDRAKKMFGDLAVDALIEKVNVAIEPTGAGPLAGEAFEDVCVDVDGTLFDAAGALRTEVVDLVRSESSQRPVTIWTNGDHREARRRVREAKVPWKVASKATLRGARVGLVIDDQPEAEFASNGISYGKYVQV